MNANNITPEELGEVAAFLVTTSAEQAADEVLPADSAYAKLEPVTHMMLRNAYVAGYLRRARETMEGVR